MNNLIYTQCECESKAKQWDNDRVNVWGLNSYFIHSAGLLTFLNAKLNMLFYLWYWGHILSVENQILCLKVKLCLVIMIKKNTDERRIRSNYSLSFMHLLISHFLTFTCWGLYDSPGGSRDWQTSSIASSTCLVGGQSSPQCHRWNGPLLKHTEILNITTTWLKKSIVTVLYISLEHKKNNLSVFLSAQFQEKFWYEHYQRRVCVHAPCVYI